MSEDNIRAARMMQSAAEDMQRAASHLDSVVERLTNALNSHVYSMDRYIETIREQSEN